MKNIFSFFLHFSIPVFFALVACNSNTVELTSTVLPVTSTPPQPTRTSVPLPTLTPTPTPSIGSTTTSEKDNAILVFVPAGKFTMGQTVEDAMKECRNFFSDCDRASSITGPSWNQRFQDQQPPHEVYLSDFWIDQTEVTNKQYAACVSAKVCAAPSKPESDTFAYFDYYGNTEFENYPVVYVDWDKAKIYCEWAGRKLPTEAEWEKAARGTYGWIYPWGNDMPNNNLLNYKNNIGDITEVRKYSDGKSVYGAYDMAGNVAEWVNDWYYGLYYQSSPISNPLGSDWGKQRVLRGGSFISHEIFVRTTNREADDPAVGWHTNYGFRCAMDYK